MNAEAINHYHSLLHTTHVQDALEKLGRGTARYNLTFGARPICTVLRPLFVGQAQYDYIRHESRLVLSALERLSDALLADARLRAELDLSRDEEQIIQIDPGFGAPDASGRLDAFLDSGGDFSFVEYNADSPGGLLYGDVLSEIFMEMDVVREFAQVYPVRRVPIRPRLLETLLDSYGTWGWTAQPRIAIVDWQEVSTRAEFEICQAYFEARGYPTVIVDPRELEYRGGWLRAGDFQINLIYKRVVTGELIARGGLDQPLVRAVRERAVCCVNSFRVQMLMKKATFAMLDDPANEHLFTADEVAALRRHVPWTRRLREGFTTYREQRIDLLEFVATNRERLVIKPSGEYGGRGVTLGWESEPADWIQTIQDALGAPFVVQERVEVLQEIFPTLVNDELKWESRYVDFDPYTWGGEDVEGAGIRLSPSALLNVTAGGGSATPLLIIER
jgi:uncharacterized circularly permuted ATP-grasp superfamily protein